MKTAKANTISNHVTEAQTKDAAVARMAAILVPVTIGLGVVYFVLMFLLSQ